MLVTAIMPTADRHALAPLAISCFLQQTYEPRELLIVDDGADPLIPLRGTTELILHPLIRYVRLESRSLGTRLTTGAKRNACCELARGELIIHWDDDDWSAPNRMADQLAFHLASGKQLTGFHNILYYETHDRRAYHFQSPYKIYATGSSQCYFRTWWEGHRFQERQLAEDTEFFYVARHVCEVASTDSAGRLVARAHGGNTWRPKFGDPDNFPEIGLTVLPSAFLEAVGEPDLDRLASSR